MFPEMTVEEFIVFWFAIYFETNKFKMFDDFKNLIFVSKFIKQKIYSFYDLKLERDYRRFSPEFFNNFDISPFAFYDAVINSNLPKIIVNQISHEIPENESTFVNIFPDFPQKFFLTRNPKFHEKFLFSGIGISCFQDLKIIKDSRTLFNSYNFSIGKNWIYDINCQKEFIFNNENSLIFIFRKFKVFPIPINFMKNMFYSFEENEEFRKEITTVGNYSPNWVKDEIIRRFQIIFGESYDSVEFLPYTVSITLRK